MRVGNVVPSPWRRAALLIVLAAIGAVALAGCTGPPPIRFLVSSTEDAPDAVPGDGVCEATAGQLDCTLRAAVDEANATATGSVVIELPSGAYELAPTAADDDANAVGDLDIDRPGSVRLIGRGSGAAVDASGAAAVVDVRAGRAEIEGVALTGATGAGAVVRNGTSAGLARASLHGNGGVGLLVEAGGTADLAAVTLSGNDAGGLRNDGTLDGSWLTVTDNGFGGIAGTGSTHLSATIVARQRSGADCWAVPSSGGYDVDSDTTCGFAGPDDLPSADPRLGPLGTSLVPHHRPDVTSPVVDAVPSAWPGCTEVTDAIGTVRPIGAGCDVGAIEVGPLDLVVDDAADEVDVAPGDGDCATATSTCTLRAAIDEVNAAPEADHVVSLATDPVLSRPGGTDPDDGGDLDVVIGLTLEGHGHTITQTAPDERVLEQHSAELTVAEATLTGGSPDRPFIADPTEVDGGAIRTTGHLTLDRVRLVDNRTPTRGGALAVADGASAEVTDSAIERNAATSDHHPFGGPPTAGAGGDAVWVGPSGSLTIAGSTVADHAVGPSGGIATSVRSEGATVLVDRSTLSGNSGRIAIRAKGGTLTVRSSTLVGPGNGLVVATDTTPTIAGSVLVPLTGVACSAPVTSGGWNLSTDTSCGFDQAGDRQVLDPVLHPLADDVGVGRTHLPADGSPLVDAIPPGTPGLCEPGSVDQRGVDRPEGDGCEIGAVEGVGPASPPLSLVVDTAADGSDGAPGDGVCDIGDGACSLRAAVEEANAWPGPDAIAIAGGVDPIVDTWDGTTGGWIAARGFLTLDGGGATIDLGPNAGLVLSNGAVNVMSATIRGAASGGGQGLELVHVASSQIDDVVVEGQQGRGVTLSSSDVTVTDVVLDGNGAGGLVATSSIVRLDRVRASGNQAQAGGGARLDASTATLTDVVLDGNVATSGGGLSTSGSTILADGLAVVDNEASTTGGALVLDGDATIRDATIAGNRSGAGAAVVASTTTSLSHVTVANNHASPSILSDGDLTLDASIVDAPHGRACGTGPGGTLGGAWTLTSDASCGLSGVGASVTAPLLGPLGDHGGATATVLPYADSPAVDAIPAGTPVVCDASTGADQRGVARLPGAACTAGAVQGAAADPAPPAVAVVVDTATDAVDADPGDAVCDIGDGTCSLRAAVDETNASPRGGTITIAAGIDPVLTLAGAGEDVNATGDLDVGRAVTIEGGGATLDAAGLDRAIDHHSPALTVRDLTLRNGSVDGEAGGLVRTVGDATFEGCDLAQGHSTAGGAVASSEGGSLTFQDSAVEQLSGSSSSFDNLDDGLLVDGGSLTLVRTDVTVRGGEVVTAVDAAVHVEHSSITAPDARRALTIAGGSASLDHATVDMDDLDIGGSLITQGAAVELRSSTFHAARLSLADSTTTIDDSSFDGSDVGSESESIVTVDGGTATITDSSLRNAPGHGLVARSDAQLTVARSAIVDAAADAIDLRDASDLVLVASTVVHARRAISSAGGTVEVTSSTLAGIRNEAVAVAAPGTASLAGSLLDADGDDCVGAVTSQGWNLADDETCALAAPGDQPGTTVSLRLSDDGTHVWATPAAGSVAIDAIPPGTPTLCEPGVVDQLGSARPAGSACDVGAVEGDGFADAPLSLLVVTKDDGPDALVGDGVCATASGTCTLRAAIDETNFHHGPDDVRLRSLVWPVLTAAPGEDDDRNAVGDLDVIDDVTIHGQGGAIVSAPTGTIDHRAGLLTLDDVVISGPSFAGQVRTAAQLEVVGSRFARSQLTVLAGGAAHVVGSTLDGKAAMPHVASTDAGGALTTEGSVLKGATDGALRCRGTCDLIDSELRESWVALRVSGGVTTLTGTSVLDNGRSSQPSVETVTVEDGTLEIHDGTFAGNAGPHIEATDASVIVSDTTITDPDAGFGNSVAGVAALRSDVTVTDTNIAMTRRGAGFSVDQGSLVLERTAITGLVPDVARSGTTVWTSRSQVTIRDSTITGNGVETTTSFSGGDVTIERSTIGAGTDVRDLRQIRTAGSGTLTLRASTVTGTQGAAMEVPGGVVVTVLGSVLETPAGVPTCAGAPASGGYNLATDATCGFSSPTDLAPGAPLLEALADNGGPTPTRRPQAASPLVDVIPVGTPGLCDASTPQDQRGQPRPAGAACDVGSVER